MPRARLVFIAHVREQAVGEEEKTDCDRHCQTEVSEHTAFDIATGIEGRNQEEKRARAQAANHQRHNNPPIVIEQQPVDWNLGDRRDAKEGRRHAEPPGHKKHAVMRQQQIMMVRRQEKGRELARFEQGEKIPGD